MKITTIAAIVFLSMAQTNALAQGSYVDDLNRAIALAQAEDCAGALDILLPSLASPEYEALTHDSKALIHGTIIDCSIDEGRWIEALDSIEEHMKLRGENAHILWLKLLIGDIAERPLASLSAAERLADVAPERLRTVEIRTIFSLLRKLKTTDEGDKRLAFLDALWAAEYQPPDPTVSLDGLRMTYARLLRDEHMTARAAALIREIENPVILADFFIDRRFDPVNNFRGMPALEDLPAMVEAHVNASRQTTEDYPTLLGAQLNYVQALRLAGEFEQAEATAAALAKEMGDNAEASPYEDYDDWAPWLLNEWAYTLYDLGRNDEARAALARAAEKDENGGTNVSQLINLSSLLNSEGKFDAALAEIARLDYDATSPYGVMWAKTVVVCARAFQGRLSEAEEELAHVRANGDDNVSALQRALLCINDIDGAAALYIERLNDPDNRGDALNALQTTLQPPHVLPIHAELRARLETVKARSDVQEAASEVGRLLELPFYPTYWGDI